MKIDKISNIMFKSGYPVYGVNGHLSEKPLTNSIEKYYRPISSGLLKGNKINYLA